MSDLLIAVAGGIAGAVLVGVGRLTTVPGAVRANDRRAHEISAELEAWVTDEARRWKIDRRKKVQDLNAAGQLYSGAMTQMIVKTNEIALIAARDALRLAALRHADVHDREDWTHRFWRIIRRRPFPELEAAERIQPVLDRWRAPVERSGATTHVRDATRATLADTLEIVNQSHAPPG